MSLKYLGNVDSKNKQKYINMYWLEHNRYKKIIVEICTYTQLKVIILLL